MSGGVTVVGPPVRRTGPGPWWLLLFGTVTAALEWACRQGWFGPAETAVYAPAGAWGAAILARNARARWPVLLCSLSAAIVVVDLLVGLPPLTAASHAAATGGQALTFAWLVTRYFPALPRLEGLRHVAQLLAASTVASAVAAVALVAILNLPLPGGTTSAVHGVVVAGAGLLGLLTLAPAVFLGPRRLASTLGSRPMAGWIVAVLVSLWLGFVAGRVAYPYLPLCIVLLGVGYLGIEGAAVLPLLTVPWATWLTVTGHGSWGEADLGMLRPVSAEAYGLTMATAALLVGALATERRTAVRRMARLNEHLETTVAERTRDLAEQARRTAALADLSRAMAEARLDEPTIWRTVADHVGNSVGDVCVISRLNADGTLLIAQAVGGADAELVSATSAAVAGLPLQVDTSGMLTRAVRTGEPVLLSGSPDQMAARSHPRLGDFVRSTALQALAIVPVVDSGVVVGTLSLHRHGRCDPFGRGDLEFLRDLAGRTGLGVANARLHARAESLAGRLQGLMDADVAGVFVIEGDRVREANDAFLVMIGRGRDDLAAGAIGWTQALPDAATCPELAQLREHGHVLPHQEVILRPDGSRLPVLLAGALLGEEPLRWIGLAIDRSEAEVAERTRARRAGHAEILSECSRLAQDSGTLDSDALNHIATRVVARLGGGCAVLLDVDGRLRPAGLAHADEQTAALQRRHFDEAPPAADQGPVHRVLTTGEPVLAMVDPVEVQTRVAPDWADYLQRVAGSHAAYLPLRARGHMLGLLFAQRSAEYEPDELTFLSDLAERVALALDNGRLQAARNAARDALAASEERFRSALDGMVDAVMMASPITGSTGEIVDFEVTYANDAHLAFGGSPRGAFLAQHGVNLQSPRLVREMGEILATGRPLRWDRSPYRRAGLTPQIGHADIRGIRVGGEVMMSWRDVTDQVIAEQSLADSVERLRLAFDESPIGAALVNLDPAHLGQFLKVNRALAELVGHAVDDLVDAGSLTLTHPQDRQADQLMLEDLGRGDHAHREQERRLCDAEGHVRWVKVTAAAIHPAGPPWYAIEHFEDITDRKQTEQQLLQRALHDPLTGLANRHLLMDHLTLALKQLSRDPGTVAVLYLDLDRFKQINDTLGHDAGDETIRQVAARLAATVRAPDTAARIGGDEFVVVSNHLTGEDDAVAIAERIRTALDAPITVGGQRIDARASIGVAVTRSPSAVPTDLLHQADLAMYRAKQQGRGRIVVYRDTLPDPTRRRSRVQQDLCAALEQGWLCLYYQPIIDLTDDRVVAAEALLRLHHPDRGLLLPGTFIDVAEDSHLIVPIGQWVLTEAAHQQARWSAAGQDLAVAVNVSARQTQDPGLTRQVLVATQAAGIDPAGLSVEMTERVLIDADDAVLRDLNDLVDLGVTITLDDFGTGYSSLTYLKQLPVRTVKIDRSFIAGLGDRPDDTAIVQAVTALASALNLDTAAEGVETAYQLEALRALGCRRAQGFHLSPPLPPDRLTEFLRTRPAGSPCKRPAPR